MKKLVAIVVLAFALLVGLECNAQQSVRIYSATELQGHHLQPIGGDYEGFCPKDLYDLAVEEGARAPEIKKTILALTGEKSFDFLNDNKNFRLAEDTTLVEGSYYNSAWDETSQKIVFFLGKRKEHCSVYFYKTKMFYIEACANFLFKKNIYSESSDLPSMMPPDDKIPLAEYKVVPASGVSTGTVPTTGATTVNLTVNCNGCEQEQQYQQPYYGGTYYQSYPQPYYGYGYGVSYGVSYSTTPVYNNHYHHNNNYYGRRHDNYNRGTTYYRYERTTGGGPGGAPGNGPGGAPGNGGPNGTPGNGGPGGAPGHGGRR